MKEKGILHPELARIVASMGHGDLLCISDAGLPIPRHVERVDLGVWVGVPGWLEVVRAVLAELRVEAYMVAKESQTECQHLVKALQSLLPDAEEVSMTHEELKQLTHAARAVVRTGEFTSFANVVLRSGVDFSRPRPQRRTDPHLPSIEEL